MSRVIFFLLFGFLMAGIAYGMECSFNDGNIIDKFINSCPQMFQPAELSYCCYDITDRRVYCCNAAEFAVKAGLGIVLPLIIAVGLVISLIVCCVSCLCCSCCPWYRRRHQGTVYGKVQAPSVVHVIQTPAPAPQSAVPTANQPPYPAAPTGMPQPYGQPYPQPYAQPYEQSYSNKMYARQAPYNPDYVQ